MTVVVNIPKILLTGRAARAMASPGTNAAIEGMYKSWAARYSADMARRYNRLARGGGEWPPLAPSTIRARRKGSGAGKPSILIDGGQLRQTINIGAPGNNVRRVRNALVFGIGGSVRKRGRVGITFSGGRARRASMSAGVSLGQIAVYHHTGAGNNPVRRILARPSEQALRGMKSDALRAIKIAGRSA
jgi:hypothetical protein